MPARPTPRRSSVGSQRGGGERGPGGHGGPSEPRAGVADTRGRVASLRPAERRPSAPRASTGPGSATSRASTPPRTSPPSSTPSPSTSSQMPGPATSTTRSRASWAVTREPSHLVGEAAQRSDGLGDHAAAIRHAEQLLRLDALDEERYRRLMRLHVQAGQRARALRVYHECVTTLERELGVRPSPETVEGYERLLAERTPTSGRTAGRRRAARRSGCRVASAGGVLGGLRRGAGPARDGHGRGRHRQVSSCRGLQGLVRPRGPSHNDVACLRGRREPVLRSRRRRPALAGGTARAADLGAGVAGRDRSALA